MPIFHNLDKYRVENWHPGDGRNIGLSISMGRSSALQACHIITANQGLPAGIVAHCCNTGLEDPRSLDFADRLDRYLGLNLVYLEYDMNSPTKVRKVTFATASRDGRPYLEFLYGVLKRRDGTIGVRPLPNPAQRTCTDQMKAKTWHRYARRHLGWPTDYYTIIGYRADEKGRYERRLKRDAGGWKETGRGLFPMYHAGTVTDTRDVFWSSMPFDLEIPSDHDNCVYCFMKSTWKLKERMLMEALERQWPLDPDRPPPDLMFWIAAEERISDRPGVFRKDRPPFRELWKEVCAGNMASSVSEGKEDRCGSCAD